MSIVNGSSTRLVHVTAAVIVAGITVPNVVQRMFAVGTVTVTLNCWPFVAWWGWVFEVSPLR